MQDTITALINPADEKGRYLENDALEKLNQYLQTGAARVKAAGQIGDNVASIISKTVEKSLLYG
ncbi:MAG: allophycocyanin subunit beta, partial [Phormidesmis sp.]